MQGGSNLRDCVQCVWSQAGPPSSKICALRLLNCTGNEPQSTADDLAAVPAAYACLLRETRSTAYTRSAGSARLYVFRVCLTGL